MTLKFRLGIFACLLAIVGAVMDHKFILIGTIWLSSFTAASYIIKLSWELIAVLIQYIKAFTEDEFSLKHWPVLAKYGKPPFKTRLESLVTPESQESSSKSSYIGEFQLSSNCDLEPLCNGH